MSIMIKRNQSVSSMWRVWCVWCWITQAAVKAGLRVNPERLPWRCLPPSTTQTVDWK